MKILLIGNGFDLAHGLPTAYKDFLKYCTDIRQQMFLNDNSPLYEAYTHIRYNTWVDYFLNCQSYIGENWIDFESEISRVIRALDEARFQTFQGGSVHTLTEKEQNTLSSIKNASKKSIYDIYQDVETIDQFTTFLNTELERLIRALEIYITTVINNQEILCRIPDIERIDPDRVLSFNYSNTYERIYGKGKSVEYDFIHGKALPSHTLETSSLVLGIDEYLTGEDKNNELQFLSFKKYYQRIYKSTGNAYLDWVADIQEQPLLRHILYIYGHSLDVTDKDVLKMLICNDSVHTKIFYHCRYPDDKRALGQMIKNLIRIIGQNELIRRTGGRHRTIEFIPAVSR